VLTARPPLLTEQGTGRRVKCVAGKIRIFLVCALVICRAQTVRAKDAFVLLSGGGSPMDNNYSQYLQAKAMSDFFLRNYPRDEVWIFFGAGNLEGRAPVLSDAHRQSQVNGVTVDSWLPGTLPQNHPARRDLFLRTLADEVLPTVADGGTLYLFVGDHGSRTDGRGAESVITLWEMTPDPAGEHGWTDNAEMLGVAALRKTLAHGIGRGKVVFCMTQCHSGGFHYLGIPHEMSADPRWFTVAPTWASAGRESFPAIAGYTATDEYSVAAGCDPDPDPNEWAGYERYMPEALLGRDLLTGRAAGAGCESFAEAHVAGTLADDTIDMPRSTSDQYLERWADLIETRLEHASRLTGTARKAVAAYGKAVDGGAGESADPAFNARREQFHRFVAAMCRGDDELGRLLNTGTRTELENAVNTAGDDGAVTNGPLPPNRRETRRLWRNTVRPAWKAAMERGRITDLPPAAMAFERHLLELEDQGWNLVSRNSDDLQWEVYWEAGYGDPRTMDPAKAQAIALWGAERRSRIVAWGQASPDATVRDAATRLAQRWNTPPEQDSGPREVPSDIAAQRTLFYRRVLAAWQFLIAVNDRQALDRLRSISDLERTPLPRPAGR
jgi:hypothetical protein